jgi:hypothetical protein
LEAGQVVLRSRARVSKRYTIPDHFPCKSTKCFISNAMNGKQLLTSSAIEQSKCDSSHEEFARKAGNPKAESKFCRSGT